MRVPALEFSDQVLLNLSADSPICWQTTERKLADSIAHVEDRIANIRAAPFPPIGARPLVNDAGDVALTDFRFIGRSAFEVDRQCQTVGLRLSPDIPLDCAIIRRG